MWFKRMKIRKLGLAQSDQARGVAVVIDVVRAFSAEAYAFAQGAREIFTVSSVEEALDWKRREPDVIVFGENMGEHVPGFDYGNSPSELIAQDLTGARLVHRSSAGTQGVVRSANAQLTLVSSLVCARATAAYLRAMNPEEVDFIITGRSRYFTGDDDMACADYIEALLLGRDPDPHPYVERVYQSRSGARIMREAADHPMRQDLELCVQANRFDFVMQVERRDGLCRVRSMKLDGQSSAGILA